MARINYSTFAARKGKTLHCDKCRRAIAKGERYKWVKPRSAYRPMVRCSGCEFKQSEITTSKMSGVYAAIETAEEALDALRGNPGDVDDAQSVLRDAASDIRSVGDEYREAAEASPTGLVFGEDLNERADAIDSGADELESWEPSEEEPDYDQCDNPIHDEMEHPEGWASRGDESCEDCTTIRDEWWDAVIDEAAEALSGASFE